MNVDVQRTAAHSVQSRSWDLDLDKSDASGLQNGAIRPGTQGASQATGVWVEALRRWSQIDLRSNLSPTAWRLADPGQVALLLRASCSSAAAGDKRAAAPHGDAGGVWYQVSGTQEVLSRRWLFLSERHEQFWARISHRPSAKASVGNTGPSGP